MKLSQCEINKKIKVIHINTSDELIKYGIFEDSEILVVKKIYGNVVIMYQNYQYVIMKNLAKLIEVEYV